MQRATRGIPYAFGLLVLLILAGALVSQNLPPAATPTPPAPGGTLEVRFLDVGQADAILVRAPGGQTLLVDGGNEADDSTGVIIPQLRAWGAERLDLLVVTHPDADHIGGLPALVENFPVANAALTGQVHTTQVYERLLADIRDRGVRAVQTRTGTALPFDPAVALQVLGPDDRFVQDAEDSNNASIVLRVSFGQVSFLLTGDAQGEEEQAILASGVTVRSTVLKLGHHGSDSSTSEAFLRAVAPELGVISVGTGNRYGHPHAAVLARLATLGVKVYRTDERGTITVRTDGTRYDVTTEK